MAAGSYGISADEVTDISNWEQIGLVVRFLKNGEPVEKLIDFIECESCTGKVICDRILQSLQHVGLDPTLCRAQTYDGAANMAGCHNGCAKHFQRVSPRATYYHCASHELNLALSHACKVPEIHNMVCALKSVGIFFKYSPKRQRTFEESIVNVSEKTASPEDSGAESEVDSSDSENDSSIDDEISECGEESEENDEMQPAPDNPQFQAAKKKIKPMCETRWVERHTAFSDFEDLYQPLLLCLETISTNQGGRTWDAKSKTEANGLLHQIKSPTFIAAFQTASYLFGFTKSISQSLQGNSMDVVDAYKHISIVRDQLMSIRQSKQSFGKVYTKMLAMAKVAKVKLSIPRRCGKQTKRNNMKGKNPITYYRRTLYVPFVDGLVQQLRDRFQGMSAHALQGLLLIPTNLEKLDDECQQKLLEFYKTDLPSPSSALQELAVWKRFW